MGKALIISDADFSSIAVSMSDIVVDKSYTNAQLNEDRAGGFCDAQNGRVTSMNGYYHKVVSVEGYSRVIINGWYPRHIGAFYNSDTSIGTSTFVAQSALYKGGDGVITNYSVAVPTGAKVFALNLYNNYSNQTLIVKVI